MDLEVFRMAKSAIYSTHHLALEARGEPMTNRDIDIDDEYHNEQRSLHDLSKSSDMRAIDLVDKIKSH